jgi:hypothetical protein
MVESRIQLWTDETQAEFAILLKNSHYVIKTNEKTEFTKMIDESALMQGYNYDWKYTLAQWVNYHFGNQALVKISETAKYSESQTLTRTSIIKSKRDHLPFASLETY